MSCTGCGFDEPLTRLIVRDELRRQIDDNKLQEALKDCDGNYLKKDMNVATCAWVGDEIANLREYVDGEVQTIYDDEGNLVQDNAKVVLVERLPELICNLFEQGDVCFRQLTEVTVDEQNKRDVLNLIFNNGSEALSVKLPQRRTVSGGSIDLDTAELIIKSGTDVLARVDIEEIDPTGAFNGVALDAERKTVRFTAKNSDAPVELNLTDVLPPELETTQFPPSALASDGQFNAQFGSGRTVLATPDAWVEIVPGFITPVYRKPTPVGD